MTRKHTPEELAEANRLLAEGAPLIQQMNEEEAKEAAKWNREMEDLEKRITSVYEDLPLKGGGTIAIRTRLSETEEKKLVKLIAAMGSGDRSAVYEIVELGTANPIITKKWLKENPDKFAVYDVLDAMTNFFERRNEEVKETFDRMQRIASFRPDGGGTE